MKDLSYLSCAVSDIGKPEPVSVDDVAAIVEANVQHVPEFVHRPLGSCVGWTVAAEIHSNEPLPPFDQSAVDGYAFDGSLGVQSLVLAGTTRAGQAASSIPSNQARRIMTGAPLPKGADRVAMQERCELADDRIIPPLGTVAGANIRRRGEDVAISDRTVEAGTVLDARHVAILAATGASDVCCLRPLQVTIIATGDELSDKDSALADGQIRDSNSPMIAALLADKPDINVRIETCHDCRTALGNRLAAHKADGTDLIVTSGGMSFGVEDHVRAAVADIGGSFALKALAMKPGKPVGLADLGGTTLLGLPGNPFAALVAFLLVGREVIARKRGRALRSAFGASTAGFDLKRRPGRTEFFPAKCVGQDSCGHPILKRLGRGGSARLAPLVAADGLGRIASDVDRVQVGSPLGFLSFSEALSF